MTRMPSSAPAISLGACIASIASTSPIIISVCSTLVVTLGSRRRASAWAATDCSNRPQ
jgi:hypothetical protein